MENKKLIIEIFEDINKEIFRQHDHWVRCVGDREPRETETPILDSLKFEKTMETLRKKYEKENYRNNRR